MQTESEDKHFARILSCSILFILSGVLLFVAFDEKSLSVSQSSHFQITSTSSSTSTSISAHDTNITLPNITLPQVPLIHETHISCDPIHNVTRKQFSPMMLINIGVRSSGTTEFASLISHTVKYKHALCWRYESKKNKLSCGEFHYWDSMTHCGYVNHHDDDENQKNNININPINSSSYLTVYNRASVDESQQFSMFGLNDDTNKFEFFLNQSNCNISSQEYKHISNMIGNYYSDYSDAYNDDDTHTKKEKKFGKYGFCNPKNYIDYWYNSYNKYLDGKNKHFRSRHHIRSRYRRVHKRKSFESSSIYYDPWQYPDFQDMILFEKSPKYYLFPHISYIFANGLSFQRTKILLFLRDPIKSLLSAYYDSYSEKNRQKKQKQKQKQLQQERSTQVIRRQLLNGKKALNDLNINISSLLAETPTQYLRSVIWWKVHEMYSIRDKLLLPFISENNEFMENVIDENINFNMTLKDVYNKIDRLWKQRVYKDDEQGIVWIFRNCHIIPLISWLKDFGYINDNDDIDEDDHDDDYISDDETFLKLQSLRNRFKIVQSEYYFANEEVVLNYLLRWTMNQNVDSRGNSVNNKNNNQNDKRKEYEHVWLSEDKQVAHSKKLRPNTTETEIYNIANYYFPCTAHIAHFLQTNEYKYELLFG